MTEDPYSFAPLPTALDAAPTPPAPHGSKWEPRLWMVCFWATFIVGLLDGFVIALAFTMGRPAAIDAGDFSAADLSELWWNSGLGILIDFALALVATVLALVVFGSARNGSTRIVPLVIWLVIRIPAILITVATSI